MNKNKAYLGLLFVALIWGSSFVVVKDSMDFMPPSFFVAVRFAIAAIGFLFFFYKKVFPIQKHELVWGVVLGVILGASYITQTIGIQDISSGKAGLITGLNVLMVPFISMAIGSEKMNQLNQWLGIFLALIGMYFLNGVSEAGFGIGEAWVLVCAFFAAAHISLTGKVIQELRVIPLSFVQLVAISAMSFVIALITETIEIRQSVNIWFSLLYTGLVITICSVVIQAWAQKVASAVETALIFNLEPVFAIFFGWLLLDETLSFYEQLGAFLMLLGMMISIRFFPLIKRPQFRLSK